MDNYLDLETRFETLARLKLTTGRALYLEDGGPVEDLIRDTLEDLQRDYNQ